MGLGGDAEVGVLHGAAEKLNQFQTQLGYRHAAQGSGVGTIDDGSQGRNGGHVTRQAKRAQFAGDRRRAVLKRSAICGKMMTCRHAWAVRTAVRL